VDNPSHLSETCAPAALMHSTFPPKQARHVSAMVQLEEARQRAEVAEKQAARNRDLPDQITALKAELQKVRFDASLATGKTR
jgi:hypothetical protein